jgi:hypothetical protein
MSVVSYNPEKTILKFFDYEGAACVVPTTMGNSDGKVLAGTPFPSNDANCLGYLLHDVDVSEGDAPGTYIYAGIIDAEKIDASVEIAAAAKTATPKVTFYGNAYA